MKIYRNRDLIAASPCTPIKMVLNVKSWQYTHFKVTLISCLLSAHVSTPALTYCFVYSIYWLRVQADDSCRCFFSVIVPVWHFSRKTKPRNRLISRISKQPKSCQARASLHSSSFCNPEQSVTDRLSHLLFLKHIEFCESVWVRLEPKSNSNHNFLCLIDKECCFWSYYELLQT